MEEMETDHEGRSRKQSIPRDGRSVEGDMQLCEALNEWSDLMAVGHHTANLPFRDLHAMLAAPRSPTATPPDAVPNARDLPTTAHESSRAQRARRGNADGLAGVGQA